MNFRLADQLTPLLDQVAQGLRLAWLIEDIAPGKQAHRSVTLAKIWLGVHLTMRDSRDYYIPAPFPPMSITAYPEVPATVTQIDAFRINPVCLDLAFPDDEPLGEIKTLWMLTEGAAAFIVNNDLYGSAAGRMRFKIQEIGIPGKRREAHYDPLFAGERMRSWLQMMIAKSCELAHPLYDIQRQAAVTRAQQIVDDWKLPGIIL